MRDAWRRSREAAETVRRRSSEAAETVRRSTMKFIIRLFNIWLWVRDKVMNNISHRFFMLYVFCLIIVTFALIGDKDPSRALITAISVGCAFVFYALKTFCEIRKDGLIACLMLKNFLEFILPCLYTVLVYAYFKVIDISSHERVLVSPSKRANRWQKVENFMNYAIAFAAALLAILSAYKKRYYIIDDVLDLRRHMLNYTKYR